MTKFKGSILPSVLTFLLCCVSALAQTQGELNQDACRKYKQADAEMNKVYKQILDEYKSQAVFVARLKAAQRAWLVFRDAHLASLYPEQDKLSTYGSVYSMCRCMALTDLTAQRTEVLRVWVIGIREGDMCSGSVKIKK